MVILPERLRVVDGEQCDHSNRHFTLASYLRTPSTGAPHNSVLFQAPNLSNSRAAGQRCRYRRIFGQRGIVRISGSDLQNSSSNVTESVCPTAHDGERVHRLIANRGPPSSLFRRLSP
jgi:hypothetical protein